MYIFVIVSRPTSAISPLARPPPVVRRSTRVASARSELLEGAVALNKREIVGESHEAVEVAGLVGRLIFRAVAGEGTTPDVLAALSVLRERVEGDPEGEEDD